MLDGKAVEEKEAAAMALSILMLYAGNRRIFRKDERGIVSATCRKQIEAAAMALLILMLYAGVHTRKLVEMNVEGSKKLLDIIGRTKIWEAFARSLG
ncbi:hypothetical protein K1719_007679 [Acacia pycnantha]|nr:hypothetical protein K1719_007679 [Acacia pycnantha]